MNWRLLTIINAAIALITLSSAIYIANRPRAERVHTAARSNPTKEQEQAAAREAKARIEALDDLSQARVDDLGAVPAAELTHLMDRAKPDQLAALAAKFNEAPTDARTFGGMAVFFQAWTNRDPQAALIGAFQLNDVTMRKLAATAVVNSVSPSAAAELVAYLTEHPDRDLLSECKNNFLDPLIASWSSLDPEAASKFVDDLGNTKSSLNSTARDNIAYNWGTLDPEAALDWIRKQEGKEYVDKSSLTDNIIRGWCEKDMPTASNYVVQHLNDPESRITASSVAELMFAHSPGDATNWIGQLPPGDARDAAEFEVANRWAEKDPAAAANWLSTLPETDQASVAGTIARSWVDTNWPEASRWIDTLSGGARDSALTAAVHREGTTPQESLSLGATIRDDARRSSEMSEAIRQWAWKDAEAAEAWIKNSSLPPEEREQLLTVTSDTQKAAAEAKAEQ